MTFVGGSGAALGIHPACSFVSPVPYELSHLLFLYLAWLVSEVYRHTQVDIKVLVSSSLCFKLNKI